MNGVLTLVAIVTVSIDTGVQRLPDGGYEYIIQLEPEVLDSLKGGQEAFSQLPPHLRDVRAYRIRVGQGELPQEWEPPAEPPVAAPPAAAASETPAPPPPTEAPFKAAPPAIEPDPASHELGPRMAGYQDDKPAPEGPSAGSAPPPADAPTKTGDYLWPPLVGALLALFASLGANVFLAWNAAATRSRYRSLVAQVHPT